MIDLSIYSVELTTDSATDLVFTVYDGDGVAVGTETVPREEFNIHAPAAEFRRIVETVVRRERLAELIAGRHNYANDNAVEIATLSAMTRPIRDSYYQVKAALYAYLDDHAGGWTLAQFRQLNSDLIESALVNVDAVFAAAKQIFETRHNGGIALTDAEFFAALAAMTPEQREAL